LQQGSTAARLFFHPFDPPFPPLPFRLPSESIPSLRRLDSRRYEGWAIPSAAPALAALAVCVGSPSFGTPSLPPTPVPSSVPPSVRPAPFSSNALTTSAPIFCSDAIPLLIHSGTCGEGWLMDISWCGRWWVVSDQEAAGLANGRLSEDGWSCQTHRGLW